MARFFKVVFLFFMLLPSIQMLAAEGSDVLVLELKPESADDTSNRIIEYDLADTPVVSFTETGISVSSESLSTEIVDCVYSDVVKMWFRLKTATEIEDAISDKVRQTVRFTDGVTFCVEGVDNNASVRVYALDGKSMSVAIDRMDNGLTVHLDGLQDGVYVIMVGNQRYKVVKR